MSAGGRLYSKVLILFSAIGVLICVILIAAIWYVAPSLVRSSVGVVDRIGGVISAGQKGVERMDDRLIRVERRVDHIHLDTSQSADAPDQDAPVHKIPNIFRQEMLSNSVRAAREHFEYLRSAIQSMDVLIESAAAVSHIHLTRISGERLENAEAHLDALISAMEELESMPTDIPPSSLPAFTSKLGEIQGLFKTIRRPLDEARSSLESAAMAVVKLKARLFFYMNIAGVVLTLILTWLAFAQGHVFYYSYFSKRSLTFSRR